MNSRVKIILIGSAFVACIALGIFILMKPHSSAPDPDDAPPPENVVSVVTVQTGALKRMTLHRYVSGYGMVEAAPATAEFPAASAQLAAPSAGVVARVNVLEGQRVEKGDVLVELNSGVATAENAEQTFERQKKLFAQQNTSLKNLQDAEAQVALLQITAPAGGTVTRLNAKPGEAVDASTVVAEVIDLNRLAVSANIPAADADELKSGEEVQIFSEPPVTASLSFVSPAVNANDGTVLTRALLPPDNGLRPGQFVQLKIVTAVHTNCLVAPAESVVTDDDGKSFIALVKGDEAAKMAVNIGFREDGWVEIAGTNLNENDSVVTVGAYGLPEKTKIRVQNSADGEASSTNSPDAK